MKEGDVEVKGLRALGEYHGGNGERGKGGKEDWVEGVDGEESILELKL